MMHRRARLVVMVKDPRPGCVKTRLGQEIGMVEAAWWFRHQVRRLLREVRDPRWQVLLAVTPDQAVASRAWPADIPRVEQGGGNLGRRMKRLLGGTAPGPVCVIGADIPGVSKAHVARAFHTLGHHDAVFGPAPDGGFWLVGMKRTAQPPTGMFRDVRWSGPHALADSMASLGGMRVALCDMLADVDTAADLARQARPGLTSGPARGVFADDGGGQAC